MLLLRYHLHMKLSFKCVVSVFLISLISALIDFMIKGIQFDVKAFVKCIKAL